MRSGNFVKYFSVLFFSSAFLLFPRRLVCAKKNSSEVIYLGLLSYLFLTCLLFSVSSCNVFRIVKDVGFYYQKKAADIASSTPLLFRRFPVLRS